MRTGSTGGAASIKPPAPNSARHWRERRAPLSTMRTETVTRACSLSPVACSRFSCEAIDRQREALDSELALDQVRVGARVDAAALVFRRGERRENDDRNTPEVGVALHPPREAEAVELGHLHVGQNQIIGLAL